MAKKNEVQATPVETEDLKVKFQEKLVALLALAKKKKNMLEFQEIQDFFKDLPLDHDKMDMVMEYLERNGIDVLRIGDDDIDDDEIILSDVEDVEVEKIDLSVPEGVSVEDPVRM